VSVQLEERVRRLEAAVGEAQAFATVALAIAEQAIAAAVAEREDQDDALAALHRLARDRITPLAAQPENRGMANRMFALLEAVMLHAAQVYSRKN